MALGVFHCGAQNFDAIGGTADIDWLPAPIASEAYDPKRTSASARTEIRRITVITHPHRQPFAFVLPGERASIIKLTTHSDRVNPLMNLFHQTMQRTNDCHLCTSSVASRGTVAAERSSVMTCLELALTAQLRCSPSMS
jgi:hypothetical protein